MPKGEGKVKSFLPHFLARFREIQMERVNHKQKSEKKALKIVSLIGVGSCSKVVMGVFKLYSAFRIVWQQFAGYGKLVDPAEFTSRARGGVGVIAIKFKASAVNDKLSCLRIVNEDDEVLVITSKGVIVRQKVNAISCQSRSATGVVVQKVDDGDHISSVSIVPIYQGDA